jgi:fumarate hydratase subunit alpha
MRKIEYKTIVETVARLCMESAFELPQDVLEALKRCRENESNPRAATILDTLLENARIAMRDKIPLCQDTGLAVVFIEQGNDVAISGEGTIEQAINEGAVDGYAKGYLRKSVVAEPLNRRNNTKTNTPAIIHHSIVPGDKLKLMVMTKGGGCENKSQFKVFKPTAEKQEIIDWVVEVVKSAGADACPPFVVGVGIGGDFELSALLSKKALLRKLGDRNNDPFYAQLEQDILKQVNSLSLGPQGLGGDTTALDCMVEFAPCHIASLPVAVNIECHSHRHKTEMI